MYTEKYLIELFNDHDYVSKNMVFELLVSFGIQMVK